jgi:hypothetical protein
MNQEKLWSELAALPPEAQQLVADFIAFLRTRYAPSGARKKPKVTNLADEPFIGLWHNRPDLADSHAWVRDIREREWMKSGD